MPITLHCTNGHKLRVSDSAAGKKVRCPKCQDVILVPQNEETETPKDDPDPDQTRSAPANRSPSRPSKSAGNKSQRGQNKGSRLIVPLIGAAVALVAICVLTFCYPRTPATDLAHNSSPSPTNDTSTVAPSPEATQPIIAQPRTTTPPAAMSSATTSPVNAPAATVVSIPESQNPLPAGQSLNQDATTTRPGSDAKAKSASTDRVESPTKEVGSTPNNAEQSPAQPSQPTTVVTTVSAGLHVWDSGTAETTAKSERSLVGRGESWLPVGPEDFATRELAGDCVIENEKLWLYIPRDQSQPIKMVAKEGDAPEVVLPITILGPQPSTKGPRSSRVAELSSEAVLVKVGVEGGGPQVALRITRGKYWIEVIPEDAAEELTIGIKAKFVVLPTEFGEDQICDAQATMQQKISSLPIPHENMVIALEREANHMSLLTYPSIRQAGELQLGVDGPDDEKNRDSNAIAKSLSAKFRDQSIFVCLLPQKDLWYSQAVTKKYSATGHIPITDKSLYPGIWRIAGRVVGKTGPAFYVSEYPDTNLLFECRQSGTCECLFYFLNRPREGSDNGVMTPLDVYRETVGQNESDAYLLVTENSERLYHRTTKYRGVCGCMDDMIDKWKQTPQTITQDPDYFTNLFIDCKVIMEHMDLRQHEYQRMAQHLKTLLDKIKPKDMAKGDVAAQEFLAAVRRCYGGLTAEKLVEAERGIRMMEDMEKKICAASKTKLNLVELEKQMERARDVAGNQEVQLKKFRGAVINLSEAASSYREKASGPMKEYVTTIGHDCRKLLRIRGRAE